MWSLIYPWIVTFDRVLEQVCSCRLVKLWWIRPILICMYLYTIQSWYLHLYVMKSLNSHYDGGISHQDNLKLKHCGGVHWKGSTDCFTSIKVIKQKCWDHGVEDAFAVMYVRTYIHYVASDRESQHPPAYLCLSVCTYVCLSICPLPLSMGSIAARWCWNNWRTIQKW